MKRLLPTLVFSLSSALPAHTVEIPLVNWTVPPYRTSGITTMADQTPPRVFIGLQPCRLLDTRNSLNPLGGGGPFGANEIRTYLLPGNCGIPTGTDAVSLNITVTNTVSNPFGHIKVWPADQVEPNVSTLNWSAGSVTDSNAAIVALSVTPLGQIKVKSGNAGCDAIMDVNGYFSDTLGTPSNTLVLANSSNTSTIDVRNASSSCGGTCGIFVETQGGHAITGRAANGIQVAFGLYGISSSSAPEAAGVRGSGTLKGVYGAAVGTGDAAGVFGLQFSTQGMAVLDSYLAKGVRGEGIGGGVLGISTLEGTSGSLLVAGHEVAYGSLGLAIGSDPPGVPPWAVFAGGNIGAVGTKYFLDPHPTDPSRSIGYISLEGPEAGTYFRGRARFQNGTVRIAVPEHFRLVTDPEGLTVQITPIGAMATVAVLRMDLNEIVVQGSRNVEFSYLVQGVRATFKNTEPMRAVGDFMPRSANAHIPLWLSPAQKKILIENGTYREDGTVNLETAHRLGWDRQWEARERPAPQPAEP